MKSESGFRWSFQLLYSTVLGRTTMYNVDSSPEVTVLESLSLGFGMDGTQIGTASIRRACLWTRIVTLCPKMTQRDDPVVGFVSLQLEQCECESATMNGGVDRRVLF